MLEKKTSDERIEDKITPVVDNLMKRVLGVRVEELSKDISDKISKRPFLHFDVDTSISFARAKRLFKRTYLLQLLKRNYGNISEVAKLSGIDRRSIHRLVKGYEVSRIRKEMPNPLYVKKEYLNAAIGDVLETYKGVIHPKKLKEVYKSVPLLSSDIIKELPEQAITLTEAEAEFEKEYIKRALEESKHNLKKAAKRIRLRYETLLRKIKKLGISVKK